MLYEINGKVYRKVEELEKYSCKGCVADNDSYLCHNILDTAGKLACDYDDLAGIEGKIYEEVDTFKSTKEMWEWLLNDNKVINVRTNTIIFMKGDNLYTESYGELKKVGISDCSIFKPYVSSEWYNNIPEKGIFCWVHDYQSDRKDYIALVIEFDPSRAKTFVCFRSEARIVDYKFATPLTKEEVLERIVYE